MICNVLIPNHLLFKPLLILYESVVLPSVTTVRPPLSKVPRGFFFFLNIVGFFNCLLFICTIIILNEYVKLCLTIIINHVLFSKIMNGKKACCIIT